MGRGVWGRTDGPRVYIKLLNALPKNRTRNVKGVGVIGGSQEEMRNSRWMIQRFATYGGLSTHMRGTVRAGLGFCLLSLFYCWGGHV